jgi:hypothetical protein
VAHNSSNVGICEMLAGSSPVRRFSPNNLPGLHKCKAEAAKTNRAWGHGRHTDWRWMASRKQRRGTGPSAHSVRSSCGTTRSERCTEEQTLGAHGRARGCALPAALAAGPDSQWGLWRRPLGRAAFKDKSTWAHIDESRRSRVMVSGNWPVRFCPLRSLQESALYGGLYKKATARRE